MNNLILQTLIMMGLAFVIGIAVAYLIELLAFFMDLMAPGGLRKFKIGVAKRRREYRFRNKKLQYMLDNVQDSSNVEIVEHYYSRGRKKKQDNTNDNNDIIKHFYGKN